MNISAEQVKTLRQRTGAGMMECKKALQKAEGDLEQAAIDMRHEGLAKADRKAGRVAAEGRIAVARSADDKTAVLLDVNCETDFVGKNPDFVDFADHAAHAALSEQPADVEALAALELEGESIDQKRRALIATLGENVTIRRLRWFEAGDDASLAVYSHGARIASGVVVTGGSQELARDLAMHVAAQSPAYRSIDEVPSDVRESERASLVAQAEESGKSADIIAKMVDGRLNKYLGQITLLGQAFVKDPDQSVSQLLESAGASVVDYDRLEVGEGIETGGDDFAAEVKAQAEKSS